MSEQLTTHGSHSLADALEEEHHQVDAGIGAYLDQAPAGPPDASSLTRALACLRRHIYVEETFLFPELREHGLVMPVMVMMREHARLWDLGIAIDALLDEDGDHVQVAPLCTRLLDELDAHNSKEEPIIYTKLESGLRPMTTTAALRFLAEGTLPSTWVPHAW